MATNITTFRGGFSIDGRKQSYNIQPYYVSEQEPQVQNQILDNTSAFFGTDKGILLLDATCTVNGGKVRNSSDLASALGYGK